jgi:hypothetical protein
MNPEQYAFRDRRYCVLCGVRVRFFFGALAS